MNRVTSYIPMANVEDVVPQYYLVGGQSHLLFMAMNFYVYNMQTKLHLNKHFVEDRIYFDIIVNGNDNSCKGYY